MDIDAVLQNIKAVKAAFQPMPPSPEEQAAMQEQAMAQQQAMMAQQQGAMPPGGDPAAMAPVDPAAMGGAPPEAAAGGIPPDQIEAALGQIMSNIEQVVGALEDMQQQVQALAQKQSDIEAALSAPSGFEQ